MTKEKIARINELAHKSKTYTCIGMCFVYDCRCVFPRWRIPGKVHGKGCLLKK